MSRPKTPSALSVTMVGPYPPPSGGMAQHIVQLCQMLQDRGITVAKVDTNYQNSTCFKQLNGKFFQILHKLCCYASCTRNIFQTKSDIIHLHLGSYMSFWGGMTSLVLSGKSCRKVVATIHGGAFPQFVSTGSFFKHWLLKFFLSRIDTIIAVNTSIKDSIIHKGLYAKTIKVMIPFWGIPQYPPPELPEPIRKFVSKKKPIISSAIFFEQAYNPETLIKGFAEFIKKFPQAGLVLMGSGSQESLCRKLATELSLSQNIIFTGDLSHFQCLEVMKKSSCFVRPPLVDGDSISVREALDLGIPVVASNTNFRPQGVVIFDKRSPNDLSAKMTQSLRSEHKKDHAKTRSDISEILEIYESTMNY